MIQEKLVPAATKTRLMPGNPATEGVVEGRGGKFVVDKNKAKELEEKKKAVEEVRLKESGLNDLCIKLLLLLHSFL